MDADLQIVAFEISLLNTYWAVLFTVISKVTMEYGREYLTFKNFDAFIRNLSI